MDTDPKTGRPNGGLANPASPRLLSRLRWGAGMSKGEGQDRTMNCRALPSVSTLYKRSRAEQRNRTYFPRNGVGVTLERQWEH